MFLFQRSKSMTTGETPRQLKPEPAETVKTQATNDIKENGKKSYQLI